MADRRRCLVSKRFRTSDGPVVIVADYEAWFLQFGQELEEDERGYSAYTVAVVEDMDGQVRTALPSMIKFY